MHAQPRAPGDHVVVARVMYDMFFSLFVQKQKEYQLVGNRQKMGFQPRAGAYDLAIRV